MMNDTRPRFTSRRRSAPDLTLATLPHLLDREVGLIQSIAWYEPRFNDPQFIHCHATLADTTRITGRICSRNTGGTALSHQVALVKAIGEGVERYCGDMFDPGTILRAPYRDVRERGIDPRRFVLFTPEQYAQPGFPFTPVTDDRAMSWVEGYSITHDRPVLVPAIMVHLGYQPADPTEFFEWGPVSGYACGNTVEEAVLGGIMEVIERDSLMVCWYNYLGVPAFDLRSVSSEQLRRTLDCYHSAPVRLHCANITTDIGIPTALAMMTSNAPGWPSLVVATATSFDPEMAIARAFQELAANHLLIRGYMEGGAPIPRQPHEVINQEDHGLLYSTPHHLNHLEAWLNPQWSISPADLKSEGGDDVAGNIRHVVGRLESLGLEVIMVDLTTPDVADLGFRVVKIVVPGIQPIDFGMQWLHYGGRRIREAPVRMGYRPEPTQLHELNIFPHPFP